MRKISGVMVVYNEEKLIETAIKSIIPIVSELIIVHDGTCKDSTIKICSKYTDQIFIRKHIGEAEPHRPFTYKMAKNDLILQIDADESLSNKGIKLIDIMRRNNTFSFLTLNWINIYKGKKKYLGRKMLIFDKSKYYFIGIPHEWPKLLSNENEIKIHLNQPLYNSPNYDNSSVSTFLTKWVKWKNIHAKYLTDNFSSIEKYNYDKECLDFPNKYLVSYPILFGVPYTLSLELFRLAWSLVNGIHTIKSSLFMTMYRLLLIVEIFRLKNNPNYRQR